LLSQFLSGIHRRAAWLRSALKRMTNFWRGELASPSRFRLVSLVAWLDRFIAFLAFERFLVIRGMGISSKGNLGKAFAGSVRLYVIVTAHVYLFWAMGRHLPAGISYLDYCAAAFVMWRSFASMAQRAAPTTISHASNAPMRIRWINLFLADFVFETVKILIGVGAIYVQYLLFPAPHLTGTIKMPNMPLLLSLFLLAALLGNGFGLVLQATRKRWPTIDAGLDALMWLLFISSGIYESFVDLPPILADYFRFNPLMPIIEYGRFALDRGYPVETLTLAYPLSVAFGLVALGLLLRRRRSEMTLP
jgi:ABC-type polysaccharide/polyol phosphate export permease